jgi:hypothetical protein
MWWGFCYQKTGFQTPEINVVYISWYFLKWKHGSDIGVSYRRVADYVPVAYWLHTARHVATNTAYVAHHTQKIGDLRCRLILGPRYVGSTG